MKINVWKKILRNQQVFRIDYLTVFLLLEFSKNSQFYCFFILVFPASYSGNSPECLLFREAGNSFFMFPLNLFPNVHFRKVLLVKKFNTCQTRATTNIDCSARPILRFMVIMTQRNSCMLVRKIGLKSIKSEPVFQFPTHSSNRCFVQSYKKQFNFHHGKIRTQKLEMAYAGTRQIKVTFLYSVGIVRGKS